MCWSLHAWASHKRDSIIRGVLELPLAVQSMPVLPECGAWWAQIDPDARQLSGKEPGHGQRQRTMESLGEAVAS